MRGVGPPLFSQRHPPAAEEHESKRDEAAFQTETGMVGSMQELRIQTVSKNKEFDERVRALRARLRRAEGALKAEAEAREAQLRESRSAIAGSLASLEAVLSEAIATTHDGLAADALAPIGVDCTALEAVERRTYEEEVPRREEELSGPVVRRMLSDRQAFDIDNTKVRAREAKMVRQFERWQDETTRRHGEEASDRFERFCVLREALADALGREARTDEKVQVWLANELLEVTSRVGTVRDARVAGDELSLERMADSMEVIQRSVLENFGAEPDDDDDHDDE